MEKVDDGLWKRKEKDEVRVKRHFQMGEDTMLRCRKTSPKARLHAFHPLSLSSCASLTQEVDSPGDLYLVFLSNYNTFELEG